jgi:hypothetical protein
MAERIIVATGARSGERWLPGVTALCATDGGSVHPFVVRWYGTGHTGTGRVVSGSGTYCMTLEEAFAELQAATLREQELGGTGRVLLPRLEDDGVVTLYDPLELHGFGVSGLEGEQLEVRVSEPYRAVCGRIGHCDGCPSATDCSFVHE